MKNSRVALYVAFIAALACGALILAWPTYQPRPGVWDVVFFVALATLLEQSTTTMRIQARGSISFVVTIAAAILFGAFWAGVIAGFSMLVTEVLRNKPISRFIFNISQKVLSITAATLAYSAMGGKVPPTYLDLTNLASATDVQFAIQRDLGLFFVLAGLYFIINSAAVSGVIALDGNRTFRDVWTTNTRGVLGYDLGAAAIAIVVAWLFTWSQAKWGFGSIVLLGIVAPLTFVRKIYGMYRNLEATSQELLEIMVKAIEARDPYTSGHSERVAKLSKLIAQEHGGLSSDEVEKIYKAALMHDVGKMYEEFAPLLRKEGKLTAEERELLQTHAIRSAELVGIVSDFKGTVLEAVRSHHERWDGRGYPNGIKGNAIPLGARIIMISDTIDAMTTDRPYRRALPAEVVIAELQKHRGSQFDPALVDLVLGSVVVRRMFSADEEPIRSGVNSVNAQSAESGLPVLWRVK